MGSFFAQIGSALRNAFQAWVILAPWEHALRVRAGKKITYLRSGIHLRIPFWDRFFIQSTRLRVTDLPIQTITTADGKTLTLKGQLGYRIEDLERLYNSLHDAEGTLVNLAQLEIADYVTSCSGEDCDPRSIAEAANAALGSKLESFGLADVRISITDYARVKTYRLITQDIWSNSGADLDTNLHHGHPDAQYAR